MRTAKVAITLDEQMLIELDRLVQDNKFPNRSKAIQEAVSEKLAKLKQNRLALECAKLRPEEEKQLAEEGIDIALETWADY